jgi:chromate transporter
MTDDISQASAAKSETPGTWREVLTVFLRLGLTSFGGPVAHLGYFREEFVAKRKWLNDRTYADIVALCQFLPGPASSQVGIAVGLSRAGYAGAFAAWMGFTLPSAIALVAFAYGIDAFGVGGEHRVAARIEGRGSRRRRSGRSRDDAVAGSR